MSILSASIDSHWDKRIPDTCYLGDPFGWEVACPIVSGLRQDRDDFAALTCPAEVKEGEEASLAVGQTLESCKT